MPTVGKSLAFGKAYDLLLGLYQQPPEGFSEEDSLRKNYVILVAVVLRIMGKAKETRARFDGLSNRFGGGVAQDEWFTERLLSSTREQFKGYCDTFQELSETEFDGLLEEVLRTSLLV